MRGGEMPPGKRIPEEVAMGGNEPNLDVGPENQAPIQIEPATPSQRKDEDLGDGSEVIVGWKPIIGPPEERLGEAEPATPSQPEDEDLRDGSEVIVGWKPVIGSPEERLGEAEPATPSQHEEGTLSKISSILSGLLTEAINKRMNKLTAYETIKIPNHRFLVPVYRWKQLEKLVLTRPGLTEFKRVPNLQKLVEELGQAVSQAPTNKPLVHIHASPDGKKTLIFLANTLGPNNEELLQGPLSSAFRVLLEEDPSLRQAEREGRLTAVVILKQPQSSKDLAPDTQIAQPERKEPPKGPMGRLRDFFSL